MKDKIARMAELDRVLQLEEAGRKEAGQLPPRAFEERGSRSGFVTHKMVALALPRLPYCP